MTMRESHAGRALTAGPFCVDGERAMLLFIPSFFSCTMVSPWTPPPGRPANNRLWMKKYLIWYQAKIAHYNNVFRKYELRAHINMSGQDFVQF